MMAGVSAFICPLVHGAATGSRAQWFSSPAELRAWSLVLWTAQAIQHQSAEESWVTVRRECDGRGISHAG